MFVKPYLTLLLLNVLKNNICYKSKNSFLNKYYHHSVTNGISSFKVKNINSYKDTNEYEEDINYEYYQSNKKKTTQKLNNLSVSMYEPRTENQRNFVEYLNDKNNSLVVVVGSAGTGKTMYSCIKAVELLKAKKIKKVIITRPVVSVEEDIGFLPGTIESKMDPYMRPIFDIFTEFFSITEWNDMIFSRVIEISPLAYMRGRTFKNSFIIADEMQNSSPNQMKMLLTRIGENSRMVITGDLSQTDRLEDNGLKDFIEKMEKYPPSLLNETNIRILYFNNTDIQRHKLVENILNIYEYENPKKTIKTRSMIKKKSLEKEKEKEMEIENKDLVDLNTIKYEEEKQSIRNKINKNMDCALIPKELESIRYKDWSREIGLK